MAYNRIHAIHRNQHLYTSSHISAHPDTGAIIPHSGGLRKIRWSMIGKGKRGGVRAIYYWIVAKDQILMLFIYPKSEKDDLTSQQLKVLREIVQKEFK